MVDEMLGHLLASFDYDLTGFRTALHGLAAPAPRKSAGLLAGPISLCGYRTSLARRRRVEFCSTRSSRVGRPLCPR